MSYFNIYGIVDETGELKEVGEVRNANGFQPIVWRHLAEIYDFDDPLSPLCYERLLNAETMKEHADRVCDLWYNFGNRMVIDTFDNLVLGSTLDGMWIHRSNLDHYHQALSAFWNKILGKQRGYTPAIPSFLTYVTQIAKDPKYRGLCMYPCSIVEDPWMFRPTITEVGDEDVEEGEYRHFNFNTDKVLPSGKEPWELYASFEARAGFFKDNPLGPPPLTIARDFYNLESNYISLEERLSQNTASRLLPIRDTLEKLRFDVQCVRYNKHLHPGLTEASVRDRLNNVNLLINREWLR